MLEVKFYEVVDDALLKFAVIVSKANGKWVFCKHKERDTYESPGGHRESGEDITVTAKRELYEETGAINYTIVPLCVYSVIRLESHSIGGADGEETFGMLYYADIKSFGCLPPESEMERVEQFEHLPSEWTYPLIQPKLLEKINSYISI